MESTLKRGTHECRALGSTLEIQQLSALGLSEIIDARGQANDVMLAAITCRYGVIGWRDSDPTEILEAHSPDTILELAAAIDALNPPRTKKKSSAKGPVAVSS